MQFNFLANLIYLRLLIISEYHKRPNKNVFLTHVRIRADELFQVSSRSGLKLRKKLYERKNDIAEMSVISPSHESTSNSDIFFDLTIHVSQRVWTACSNNTENFQIWKLAPISIRVIGKHDPIW